ncbi:MarR family winged helix-turn-helix transcriptional regulator [Rhizobium leguminosarum]|uniref:MarR family winged helix-turn-helix transcriptional regulator n=1 Tax=Rhizobium leguminosarum TaxID=384 RepID=UPI001C974A09|nr:MarR family transcriptional regulator [Rhizobium leguminosarum]
MSIPLPPDSIPDALPGPPFFGALLRIVWQHVRERILQAIHEAGFADFQEAHFAVFSFPLPDGMRPSELARQKRMSRQAVNYLLSQLEELGYVERRAADGSDRRLVYLTPRGHEVVAAIFACLRQLHEQWSKEVGKERFDDFVDVLKQLSTKAQEPINR